MGEIRIPLARGILEKKRSLAGYEGKNVVIGIRPEAMDDATVTGKKEHPIFSAVTELTDSWVGSARSFYYGCESCRCRRSRCPQGPR